jgi:hypothetical protein
MRANMTRRIFLRTLAYLSALGFTRPSSALAKLGMPSNLDALVLSLDGFFTQKDSVAIIGNEYLKVRPHEADARLLVDLIFSCQPEQTVNPVEARQEELRDLTTQQIRTDFEDGRIVRVRGWILSETEARLCALVALI